MMRGIAERPAREAGPTPQGTVAAGARTFPGTHIKVSDIQNQRQLLDIAADVMPDEARKREAKQVSELGQRLERRLEAGDVFSPNEVANWLKRAKELSPDMPEFPDLG